MKKFKNWKWQMWQVHLMGVAIFFLTMAIWFGVYYFHRVMVVKDRDYIFYGQDQDIRRAVFINDGQAVALALTDNDYDISIGRQYIVIKESKLKANTNEHVDSEEYYRLHYYPFARNKLGKKQTLDLLKLLKEEGITSFESVDGSVYSDGKDDILGIHLNDDQYLYLNLTSKKLTKKKPKEEIIRTQSKELKEMNSPGSTEMDHFVDGIDFDEDRIRITSDEEDKMKLSFDLDYSINTEVTSILQQGGQIYFLKERMTLEDYNAASKWIRPINGGPNSEYKSPKDLEEESSWFESDYKITWRIDEDYSKDGQAHFVTDYQEFKKWYQPKEEGR